MDFETFWNGAALHYMGSDGVEYIAKVRRVKGFPDIRSTDIFRADGKPIVVKGVSYPRGYVLGAGRFYAVNMHDEAVRYPVSCVEVMA